MVMTSVETEDLNLSFNWGHHHLHLVCIWMSLTVRSCYVIGVDPGFFSGWGSPLRNGVTDWWAKQLLIILKANTKKKALSQWGAHPLPLPLPQRQPSTELSAVLWYLANLTENILNFLNREPLLWDGGVLWGLENLDLTAVGEGEKEAGVKGSGGFTLFPDTGLRGIRHDVYLH